jgi:23S rRNA (guanosine2251-2'-O)-methyltransferase
MGRNCVVELMRRSPEKLVKIYCSNNSVVQSLENESDSFSPKLKNIELRSVDWLTNYCSSTNHQGLAAEIKPINPYSLNWLENKLNKSSNALFLALDKLEDAQNLGAILRLAECFGVDGVIYSKNRMVKLSPVVAKASVGAIAFVPIVEVSNLVAAIKRLKESGAWVVATALDKDSQDIGSFDFPEKSIIVFGSEGKGISRLLLSVADYKVKIPLHGEIQSLNVSQAGAITLFSYQQHLQNSTKEQTK